MLYYNNKIDRLTRRSCREPPHVAPSSRPRGSPDHGSAVDLAALRLGAARLRGGDHCVPVGGGPIGEVVKGPPMTAAPGFYGLALRHVRYPAVAKSGRAGITRGPAAGWG